MIDNALWGYVQPKGGWEAFADRMRAAEAKAQAMRKEFVIRSATSTSVGRKDLRTKYEADHQALADTDPLMELINSPDADMFSTGESDQSKLVPVFHRRSFVDDIWLEARLVAIDIELAFAPRVLLPQVILTRRITKSLFECCNKWPVPFPSSKKGMQSFLGALNYYGRFIQDLAA
ncbi:Hypothetical protein PHPALM_5688 [Phytophthora palmivora]|uniref:Reverse transcriptase n=1 Tax=Phytophthora palmivora TaxID=4796 RepID=A0A2P4YGQ9_9STRA|nr:Hypothetical protein PHPALM_5688 [Phytophthora palmivora]